VRTRAAKSGASIRVDTLVLNGVSISDSSSASYTVNSGLDILRVQGASLAAPFTLTGNATLSWNASNQPTQSQLAFQVKFGPPSATPPTVHITSPTAGTLFGKSPVTVTGMLSGTAPVTVSVNSVQATVLGDNLHGAGPACGGREYAHGHGHEHCGHGKRPCRRDARYDAPGRHDYRSPRRLCNDA